MRESQLGGENPVEEVFALLDKLYNQRGMVLSQLKTQVEMLESPRMNDPDSIGVFIISVQRAINGFKAAKQPIDDQVWFYMDVLGKLPLTLQQKWVRKRALHKGRGSVTEFLEFLVQRELTLRACPQVARRVIQGTAAAAGSLQEGHGSYGSGSGTHQEFCKYCKSAQHQILDCSEFKKLNHDQRLKAAYKCKIHFWCLKNHRKEECPEQGKKCGIKGCIGKHHPLLHGACYRRDFGRDALSTLRYQ